VINIPEGTPTDMIIAYRQQGYDDDTIIQGLQQQGYSAQQVNDAVTQANQKKQAVASPVQGSMESQKDTEAVVESIVEEKWSDFQNQMKSFIEWKEKADSQLVRMEQELGLLKQNFETLHEGILGKISEYDNNLKNVGSSVKAMDQVFKKVLPSLTDSVNKLSRIANK